MKKTWQHPLFFSLLVAILTGLVGYLINQLPSLPDFAHKDAWTIIAVIVITVLSGWIIFWQAQQDPTAPNEDLSLRSRILKAQLRDVNQRLSDSLHQKVLIDLTHQEKPELVGRVPLQPLYVISPGNNPSPQPIPRLMDVLWRDDIGGRLLILGQPGSGKTTTLLDLAKECLKVAEKDTEKPLPLIFELSAWRENFTDLVTWLSDQLKSEYNLSPEITKNWIQTGKLLPLLDGLDELGLEKQKKCIAVLQNYLAADNTRHLVVCCREEEYKAGQDQLTELKGSVVVQPLSDGQIRSYLDQVGKLDFWQTLLPKPKLVELARTPLLLSIMVVAVQGKPIQSETELFDAYIERQFALKPISPQEPDRPHSLHYLKWLATQLQARQTEFLIENLQPSWLSSKIERAVYGLIVGLVFGLLDGLIMGVFFGLFFGLMAGLIFWIFVCLRVWGEPIQLVEAIQFPKSWVALSAFSSRLTRGLISGLYIWLMDGLIIGLLVGLNSGITVGLIWGVLFAVIAGLIWGVICGLTGELNDYSTPNQGIKNSLNNVAFLLAFFMGLWWVIPKEFYETWLYSFLTEIDTWRLTSLIPVMVFGASFLKGGGVPVLKHCSLRVVLYFSGHSPWNYARFLHRAAERRLIQQVGGRYRFIHRLLQDHFANLQE